MDADVIIVGGGLVGLTAGLATAQAGFETLVLDASPATDRVAAAFDGRASALAYANFRMLETLGVSARLEGGAQPISEILVTDGRPGDGLRRGGAGAAFLRFDPSELSGREAGEPLGYMVENRRMRGALLQSAAEASRLTHRAPEAVRDVSFDTGAASVTTQTGEVLKAPLVVGAEGRHSLVRDALGVRVHGWGYRQSGVVATVRCERPHGGVAHEYFLPSGPFAILPLTENRASLVWTERNAAAKAAVALDDAAFAAEIARRFGDFLGEVRPEGPRWSYPLELRIAERFAGARGVLIGDAARRIHPIAGQGFNLGLKDAAALADVLRDASRLGEDIGGLEVLLRYQRWRRFDSAVMAVATDVFNRLFSTDLAPVRLLRDAGLAMVNRIPPARRLFMRDAGADLGDLPRLLRGERLDA